MFDVILSRHRHASQILLVNDRYDMAFSIKYSERNLRSTNPNGTKNVFIRASDRFPSARMFQVYCAILQVSNAYKPSCTTSSVWCAGDIQTLSSSTLLVPIVSDYLQETELLISSASISKQILSYSSYTHIYESQESKPLLSS